MFLSHAQRKEATGLTTHFEPQDLDGEIYNTWGRGGGGSSNSGLCKKYVERQNVP